MKKKKIMILVIIVALACCAGLILKGCTNTQDYNDTESFNKFAQGEINILSRENALKNHVEINEDIKFKDTVSYGISYVTIKNSIIGNFIDEYIGNIKDEIDEYEKDNFNSEDERIKKAAFIVRTGTYQGDLDTGSILISTEKFIEPKDGKFLKDSEEITAFNFLEDKKIPITFSSAFNLEKKEELIDYLVGELEGEYKDILKKDYRITLESNGLENFILTGKDAEFIFNSNTVTTSNDAVRISISKDEIPGLFRNEIKARSIDPTKPMVALTFDDGPDPKYTEEIIDTLEKNNSVGTFYLVGENLKNVKETDRILKKIVDNGDEIGTHSYNHPNMFKLTDEQVKEQNDKTDEIIKEKIGITATTYRPPFGNGNEKTTKIFNKAGVLWSIDTMDWKTRNASSIVAEIKKEKNLNGHVILMHSIYDFSATAAKEIIPWLNSKGYQLVTVSELLQYKYNVNPNDKKFYGYGYFHTVDK